VNLKICYLKIDVSGEASVNFQHISQNATAATEFARCHHFEAALTMRLVTSKVLRLPRNWNSSSENVAKVLRLP